MHTRKPDNDNVTQSEAKKLRRVNFSWKMEYFPRKALTLVGAEATDQQETRPLRVLTINLKDEM